MDEKTENRFWNSVLFGAGCWLWQKELNEKGYGRFRIGKKWYRAHRVAWLLERGNPGELLVCHNCDTPPCVRPSHLFLGTPDQNTKDSLEKNRMPHARLTAEKVQVIRERRAKGEFLKVLASEFGVSEVTISNISRGRAWRSAPGPVDDKDWRGMRMQYEK